MQCYTQLLPPTAVSHAISLSFLGPKTSNLLVVKTSLLQVYTTKTLKHDQVKLVLVGEYAIAGTVTSISAVKVVNTRSGGSAALLAFRDAKLSLIEWDPANHRISTVSIHFYEGTNVVEQPFGPGLACSEALLAVDPSSRCAALKFGARHLAILPFCQHGDELGNEADDEFDMDIDTGAAGLNRTVSGPSAGPVDKAPYKPSFVLPLTALDPSLIHLTDLVFLHEYREPTFGILSSPIYPSSSLLGERKDCLTYSVYTLDLEQRASTNLITVSKLPSDLWKVVPLQSPVGGALLIGENAFVHIDQSGKVTAVAVNEFATQLSDFGMSDQSALNLKLEGCEIEILDAKSGDLLIVLNDGSLVVLSFQILGRNVGDLIISPVSSENGGHLMQSAASAIASMPDRKVFVGSEDGPSKLLVWSKSAATTDKKRSYSQMMGNDRDDEDEEVGENVDDADDDDLYAPSGTAQGDNNPDISHAVNGNSGIYSFSAMDELQSLGPINNIALGRPNAPKDRLELLAGVGRSGASRLACISKEIVPQRVRAHPVKGAKRVWAVNARDNSDTTTHDGLDNFLFVYDGDQTKVFDIVHAADDEHESEEVLVERHGTEFEVEGETLTVTTIGEGRRIVQCRRNEIRTYDQDLGLVQIIPMMDEETDAELQIVAFSFHADYILVIRDDSTAQIFKLDKGGEVEPLEQEEEPSEKHKWISGSLYGGAFTLDQSCAFLLDHEGGMHVYGLPEFRKCYSTPALPHLPPIISMDSQKRRVGARETLVELLVADLGTTEIPQAYMILRGSFDDLTLYEPFHGGKSNDPRTFQNLRFRKVPNTYLPRYDEALNGTDGDRPAALQRFQLANRHVVHIQGNAASLIVKEPTSLPKTMQLRLPKADALYPWRRNSSTHSFILANGSDELQEWQMRPEVSLETGWSVHDISVGEEAQEVRHISYHEERNVYIVASCRNVDFVFPDDEIKYTDAEDVNLRPQIPRYTLHLMLADTKEVINTVQMPYLETVTSMQVMQLEVSEHSRERRSVLVVGSAAMHGEDRPARGTVTVFELIDVVPEVGRPETGIKLKPISREQTKGAVTALDALPGGLLGTVQGQKIMVRGLKEDGSCLPVAFLDALCNIITLKTLGHSGMWLAGDAWKGLWLGGFVEEPYRLSVLGKSRTHMEVMAAEFLPFDEQLFIMVIDANTNLHVLQYDPENPKSLSGTRLLHRGAFHIGHFPTSMKLLPSMLAPFTGQPTSNGHLDDSEMPSPPPDDGPSLFHVLVTSQSGTVDLITPVDEGTYRRLAALQTHLTSILEHPAGLNPRAYRAAEGDGSRSGVIDGSLIQRISELGTARRAEVLGRAGGDVWGLRSDLEIVTGRGLEYL